MPRQAVGLVLVAAALHALALPPWSVAGLRWVALVPLLLVVARSAPLRAAGVGLLWGTATMWGIAYWVPVALSTYYAQPLWVGLALSMLAALAVCGLWAAGFAATAAWLAARTSGVARIVTVAALWVSFELARSWPAVGNPWLLLGYSLVPDEVLRQAADLGGVYLLSFLVVAVNASIADLLLEPPPRRATAVARRLAPVALLLLAAWLHGRSRLTSSLAPLPALEVAVVQPNVDLGWQWRSELYGRSLDDYLDLSRRAVVRKRPRPELLIWPENAVTFFLEEEPAFRRAIGSALAPRGVDLIVGGPAVERPAESPGESAGQAEARYFNSAFYLTADGRLAGRYDKLRLLPFAEYFPLGSIDLLRRSFARVRSFTPGGAAAPLPTRFGKVAVAICFEAIFPELVRAQMVQGARLLVNLSNDAWLGPGPGSEQHLAMVRLRAVENRTWVVRSTPTGISAVVDPEGRVVERGEPGARTVLRARVGLGDVATVYRRFGDVFAWACLAWALLASGYAIIPSRRMRLSRP